MKCHECREFYSVAIGVEISARVFYTRMLDYFHLEPDAAETFEIMAREEADHASTLTDLKNNDYHPLSIHRDAPRYSKGLLKLFSGVGMEMMKTPRNLEDALALSLRLEHSEVNDVYRVLATAGEPVCADQMSFVDEIMSIHIRRLHHLSERYASERRLVIYPDLSKVG